MAKRAHNRGMLTVLPLWGWLLLMFTLGVAVGVFLDVDYLADLFTPWG
jgi:hypothetical protein